MSLTFDEFLLILRVASIAVLYLFILQVVLVARRDLAVATVQSANQAARSVIGHLVVVDSGSAPLVPGATLDIVSPTSLGRAPINTIVLESNLVSLEHARIFFRNNSLWVEDLHSRNGTFLNDQQLQAEQPVAVRPRDILRLGDVRFRIVP
jgi:pSer/pThr/pTyr-binding forkhead associated (FHA) protein